MNDVGIIGTGQSRHARRRTDVSQPELIREAVNRALEDADVAANELDAVLISNMEMFEGRALPELWVGSGAHAVRVPCMKVATGGTSGTSACIAGFHQVGSGLFDTVLVVGFEKHSEGHTQTGMALTDPFWDRGVASGALGNFALSDFAIHGRTRRDRTAGRARRRKIPSQRGAQSRTRTCRTANAYRRGRAWRRGCWRIRCA